ncbi:MAG: hypothetical protein JW816_03135 [Candidatus Buchananbacteria bacterium]|nr:hypothetical protein [Candidatus Buchananbacteria bacterium]
MNKSLAPWLTGALCLVIWYFAKQKFGYDLELFVLIFAIGYATQSVLGTWRFRKSKSNQNDSQKLIENQILAKSKNNFKPRKIPKKRF